MRNIIEYNELVSILPRLTDEEKQLLEEYDVNEMSDYEIADEIVAFAAEKLLDNYTIEDIASGTVDLSLYPEPIQEVLFKTLNYIRNGNLQQSRSNRDGRQYDNQGNAESNLGNVQRGVEKEPGQKDTIGKAGNTE